MRYRYWITFMGDFDSDSEDPDVLEAHAWDRHYNIDHGGPGTQTVVCEVEPLTKERDE